MTDTETLPPVVGGAWHFQLQVFRRGAMWIARYRHVRRGVSLFAKPCTAEAEDEARALLYDRVKTQGFLD